MAQTTEGEEVRTKIDQSSHDYDEKIMAQERLLEKEVQESAPLVADVCELSRLREEYLSDPVYLQKVSDLQNRYSLLRRTRGDGNCFFRAFGFSYFEYLLRTDPSQCKAFKQKCTDMKDVLISTLGFPQFTVEDFHDTFIETVEKLEKDMKEDDLKTTFNEQGLSDYLIVFLRLITSGQLQKEAAFYENFVDGGRTVKDFCNQEVEPMSKESDHIHIIALTTALDVSVSVEYMDRGARDVCVQHVFPEGTTPKIFLLYRPGHYDILYKQNKSQSSHASPAPS